VVYIWTALVLDADDMKDVEDTHTAQHGRMAAILVASEDTQWRQQEHGVKSRFDVERYI